MPPLRLLLIVLLLLNLLALATGLGWLGSSSPRGEPERLTNQVDPDRIQLELAAVENSAEPPAPALTPEQEVPGNPTPEPEQAGAITGPTATEVARGASPRASRLDPSENENPNIEPQAAAPLEDVAAGDEPPTSEDVVSAPRPDDEPLACISLARLSEQQTSAIERIARLTTPLIVSETTITDAPDAWWVRIPPTGSRQAAEQRADALRALGISDLFIVRAEGPNQYSISLGIFRTEARARQHFSDLEAQRVRGAEIAPRTPARYRVQLTGPESSIAALNNRLVQAFPDLVAEACAP